MPPLLATTEISKRFGSLVVLDAVSIDVQEGSALGIVGPNGAGKTTLLDVLAGAGAPQRGTVTFDGRDITRLGATARCRLGIGRTHQIPRPFADMTVFENVLVGATQGAGLRGSDAQARALQALSDTGTLALGNRRAETLGLLDRKRLELARALATGPRVLLLDEIAGGLTEAETTALVSEIVELRARGIAIVWIEHVVHALLQVAQRLVCLAAGRVIAAGEPDAVMRDPAVVKAYLGERAVSLLELEGLEVRHGLLTAVRGVSLELAEGETVALVGANGAGKSTLLRAIAGAHRPSAGAIRFNGRDITALPAYRRVALGMALVPEGRHLFPRLTVQENLLVASRPGPWSMARVLEAFPMLQARRRHRAATLSGGERQATAIGRALMSNPRLLLLDEVSLGLAPVAVDELYRSLDEVIAGGTTVVLVEQDLARAMTVAQRVVCMLEGEFVLQGPADQLTREQVTDAYFGLARAQGGGR